MIISVVVTVKTCCRKLATKKTPKNRKMNQIVPIGHRKVITRGPNKTDSSSQQETVVNETAYY